MIIKDCMIYAQTSSPKRTVVVNNVNESKNNSAYTQSKAICNTMNKSL